MTSTHTLALEALPPLEDARYGDNARLARRIRTGDQAAFRELAEGHQSRICWVIARIVHNRQDAEEIAQEVFAKVYFSIRSFAGRSSLFNWIYRMAVNECYAHLRKKRVELVFEADEPAADPGSAADERPAADRVLIQRDFVSKLLARLSKEDRVLLLWKEVEGLSVAQLAAMTGQNENTIKVRLIPRSPKAGRCRGSRVAPPAVRGCHFTSLKTRSEEEPAPAMPPPNAALQQQPGGIGLPPRVATVTCDAGAACGRSRTAGVETFRTSWRDRLRGDWDPFPETVEDGTIAAAFDKPLNRGTVGDARTGSGHTCHWLYKNIVMGATGRIRPCCGAPRLDAQLVFGRWTARAAIRSTQRGIAKPGRSSPAIRALQATDCTAPSASGTRPG